MELIPGIPEDLAKECLVRVHYTQLPAVVSVCKSWKSEVGFSEFRRLRKQASSTKTLLVVAQSRVDPYWDSPFAKFRAAPVYRLSVLDPETGDWSELPPIPGDGLPMFCRIASVGSDLVVIGGLNPLTWEASRRVFVFSFLTATWRRGSDMPGPQRSLFGCASDGERMVYVAGGHDEEKNATRSSLAYDVARDEWVTLPDMARERDECQAVFRGGRFHVVGGYRTESQGMFERSAEVFDVARWRWDRVEDEFLDAATCPRTCVCGEEGDLYMCRGGYVLGLKGSKWQVVCELPGGVSGVAYVGAWKDKVVVIGTDKFSDPHVAYVLDLKSLQWTTVETPEEFSGHVQSGCCLEI